MIQPISRNHIILSLGYKNAVTEEDVEVLPEDIQYKDRDEDKIILIKGLPVFTLTPRLTFCKALMCFEAIENEMIEYTGGNHIAEMFVEGSATMGYNNTIGLEGFGYVQDENGKWLQIPHFGMVVFESDVEIANLVNIDRGTLGETRIRRGTKIDSHVHIAHNCDIGEHNLIVAGSIIGGSVKTGRGCYLGMGCKIKNKVTLGDNVTVGMGAVVLDNIPDNETWAGVPARKIK